MEYDRNKIIEHKFVFDEEEIKILEKISGGFARNEIQDHFGCTEDEARIIYHFLADIYKYTL